MKRIITQDPRPKTPDPRLTRPRADARFATDATVKHLKVMLRPGERVVFTVLSAEEFALVQWAKNKPTATATDQWVRRVVMEAAKYAVAEARLKGDFKT